MANRQTGNRTTPVEKSTAKRNAAAATIAHECLQRPSNASVPIAHGRLIGSNANDTATSDIACDVAIVGCGAAGLYCALNLPRQLSVVMLAKTTVDECDSMLAQGGICVAHDADDYAPFFWDTLRAGHFENRRESVDLMIRASRSVINSLIGYGVQFERDGSGALRYTREGAHSCARICYHDDTTGAEITTKLLAAVQKLQNVRILEHTCMDDILVGNEWNAANSLSTCENAATEQSAPAEACYGIVAHNAQGNRICIHAKTTVWACGGIGGTYERSTNFPCLTGDAVRIARAHNIALEHTDYVQIHPTSLYTTAPGRAFLISESCRGEGAVLLNAAGERFVNELQPRDVVSHAIYRQMAAEDSAYVRLSFANVPREEITGHFKHIYERCLAEGYDITREPIPVVPAQHYFMGGVHVDRNSATTMPRLYAVGETSCNGVHGKNRLASNSLLESLVFGQRAAWDIARQLGMTAPHPQTYAEHPQGADAKAYARFCAMPTCEHDDALPKAPAANSARKPNQVPVKKASTQARIAPAKSATTQASNAVAKEAVSA